MKNILIRQAFLFLISMLTVNAQGQRLQPGFDKEEYLDLLKVIYKTSTDIDKWAADTSGIPDPKKFKFVYRSPEVGLDNLWELWVNPGTTAVVSVRGSILTQTSFLANLYAAMAPAKGSLQLEESFNFHYRLSDNPNAAVHVGWLVSMAFLSRDILPKIDSCYKAGIKDFILTGHSQGGGIVFLLTSYLKYLQQENKIPADIQFKTYCSAGPKPGNLFYAYDYEHLTEGGWAFNAVNTADWVPEVPFSVQTVNDFTLINPFTNAKAAIKKLKFPKNLVLKHVYNRLSKPSLRAQRRYQRYLGKMASASVKKQFPHSTPPEYYKSNYYVRTGTVIVLYADEEYNKVFVNDPNKPEVWKNHLMKPYLYLAEKLP